MKVGTSTIDAGIFAREFCVTALFTVLLLVAGCAENNYETRAELAPPPPTRMAELQSEVFGPAIPLEIAMMRNAENIEPAAGDDASAPVRHKCLQSLVPNDDNTRMDIGFGSAWQNHDDALTFNSSYAGPNSPGMMVRWTMDIPGANVSSACR